MEWHHLAGRSLDGGRLEIYVRSFPTPGAEYRISKDGGVNVNSTQNGKELIFTSPNTDRRVWSVSVSTEPTFKVGEPRELFKARLDVLSLVPTPRGDRLLQSVPAGDVPPPGIAVTLNWQAMVSRR